MMLLLRMMMFHLKRRRRMWTEALHTLTHKAGHSTESHMTYCIHIIGFAAAANNTIVTSL